VLILLHGLGAIQVVIYVVVYAYGTDWHPMATGLAGASTVLTLALGVWATRRTSAECEKQVGWNLLSVVFMACIGVNCFRAAIVSKHLVPFHSRLIHIICFAFLVCTSFSRAPVNSPPPMTTEHTVQYDLMSRDWKEDTAGSLR
jgi:hypothetical protein